MALKSLHSVIMDFVGCPWLHSVMLRRLPQVSLEPYYVIYWVSVCGGSKSSVITVSLA